ncbi:hypothetical protein EG329_005382 [Mollisiaceae sp. DMI_Dod_QoI]|nr:hypothetical protein EG329_005382 [Helotiales sp. DMI_Dod_QoI]
MASGQVHQHWYCCRGLLDEARPFQYLPQTTIDDMERVDAFMIAGYKNEVMAEFQGHPRLDPLLVVEVQKGVRKGQPCNTTQHYYFARDDDYETPVSRLWYEIGEERWGAIKHNMKLLYDAKRYCVHDKIEFRLVVWSGKPGRMHGAIDISGSQAVESHRERRHNDHVPRQDRNTNHGDTARNQSEGASNDQAYGQRFNSLYNKFRIFNSYFYATIQNQAEFGNQFSIPTNEDDTDAFSSVSKPFIHKEGRWMAELDSSALLSKEEVDMYFREASMELLSRSLGQVQESKA